MPLSNFRIKGQSFMRMLLYAILPVALMTAAISCSNMDQSSDRLESKRGLLSEEQQYYIDNIDTVRLLIDHIGEQDTYYPCLLFKCSKDGNNKRMEVVSTDTPEYSPHTAFPLIIIISCNEFENVLYIIFSKSDETIVDPNLMGKSGTYGFCIYNKQQKIEYVFNSETRRKVIKEIINVLPQHRNELKELL